MQILSVNNTLPGNQGVSIYFDGMDMVHIEMALRLLAEDFEKHLATDDLDPETRKVHAHQRDEVVGLRDTVAWLNEYLDSINTNLVLDSQDDDE